MTPELIKILSDITSDPAKTYEELDAYIQLKVSNAEIAILQKQIDKLRSDKVIDEEKVNILTAKEDVYLKIRSHCCNAPVYQGDEHILDGIYCTECDQSYMNKA